MTFKDQHIWTIFSNCINSPTNKGVIKNYVKLYRYLFHQNDIPIKMKKKVVEMMREKIKQKRKIILPILIVE